MAVQAENSFQPVIDRFEDDILALAYYIKDRDVICGEYKYAKSIIKWMVYIQSTVYTKELNINFYHPLDITAEIDGYCSKYATDAKFHSTVQFHIACM